MSSGFFSVDGLERQARALSTATNPSEVFRGLLEGARLAAPRAAIFLVRKDLIKGWGSVGYSPEASQRQRAHSQAANAGWLGRLAASRDVPLEQREGGGLDPEFGQPAASDAVALPVRVKGRTIALVLAERSTDEEPWFPPALALLVHVARLRLDLDLALRKLQTVSGEPAKGGRTPQVKAAADAPGRPRDDSKSLSPVEDARSSAPAGDSPELEAARRFARLVATDIRLYNEEAVATGRRERDLTRRLADPLARGRETFRGRFGELGPVGCQLLHDAFVEVLAGGDAELLPAPAPAGTGS